MDGWIDEWIIVIEGDENRLLGVHINPFVDVTFSAPMSMQVYSPSDGNFIVTGWSQGMCVTSYLFKLGGFVLETHTKCVL